jgi:hypothetical protein
MSTNMKKCNYYLVFIFILSGHFVFAQSSDSWPIFRGNQQLNRCFKTELAGSAKTVVDISNRR